MLLNYSHVFCFHVSDLRMSPIHIQNTPAFYHNSQQEDRPKVSGLLQLIQSNLYATKSNKYKKKKLKKRCYRKGSLLQPTSF